MDLVKILKALADENRVRILNILRHGELCVCEIQEVLDMNQSNVSRHLAKLSEANLVVSSKKAQWVSYRINDAVLRDYPFIGAILGQELDKLKKCREDLERLKVCQQNGIPCGRTEGVPLELK